MEIYSIRWNKKRELWLTRFRWQESLTSLMKKINLFRDVAMSILLYRCTTRELTKRMKKKLDKNYSTMLRAVLNSSLKQHPTEQLLNDRLPPISQTIQVRRTGHWGELLERYVWTHNWRSFMDTPVFANQCSLTSKELLTSSLCGYWMFSRRYTRDDGW